MSEDDVVERTTEAVARAWYGPNFDPHLNPEAWDMAETLARAALSASGLEALQAENVRLQETVRRVQSAAKTIMHAEGEELALLRQKSKDEWGATKTLDSEREANARLTGEVEALQARVKVLEGALETADDAIREMFRYFDGGETRGSYDGRPERDQLRKAGYAARQALTAIKQESSDAT